MSNAASNEPNKSGPTRAIGVLNILYGGFFTLVAVGLLFLFVPFLRLNNPLHLDPVDTRFFVEEMRRTTLSQLQERENTTSNATAKGEIAKARAALQSKSAKIENEVDFQEVNQNLPWFSRYLWLDLASAPIPSFFLGLSGLGLIFRKEWSRRLALVVSSLMIARLLALSVFLLAVVVPRAGRVFRAFAKSSDVEALIRYGQGQLGEQGGLSAQIAPGEFAEILVALGQGYALINFFIGMIYPVIVVIVLTRPSARAACSRFESSKT